MNCKPVTGSDVLDFDDLVFDTTSPDVEEIIQWLGGCANRNRNDKGEEFFTTYYVFRCHYPTGSAPVCDNFFEAAMIMIGRCIRGVVTMPEASGNYYWRNDVFLHFQKWFRNEITMAATNQGKYRGIMAPFPVDNKPVFRLVKVTFGIMLRPFGKAPGDFSICPMAYFKEVKNMTPFVKPTKDMQYNSTKTVKYLGDFYDSSLSAKVRGKA